MCAWWALRVLAPPTGTICSLDNRFAPLFGDCESYLFIKVADGATERTGVLLFVMFIRPLVRPFASLFVLFRELCFQGW